MLATIIPFPQELRPTLPTIVGNVDYLNLRQWVEQIDALLRQSALERQFVQAALERWSAAGTATLSARQQQQFQQRSRRALRCTILKTLLQEDYRGFSCQLAGNPLYQWFCLIDALTKSGCLPRASYSVLPIGCLKNRCGNSSTDSCRARWSSPGNCV